MFRFKYTVNWIVVISLGLGVTWTNISSKQYSVPWTKTLLELWVPTEMTIHNTQLGITECIYFLSNCDWCTTLNIFFFFFGGGEIFEGVWVPWSSLSDHELMKLVAILGLWWGLRTFWWCFQNIIIDCFF